MSSHPTPSELTLSGNVMWWGNPLWTNALTYNTMTLSYNFVGDLKSPAWTRLGGQTHLMLLIHDNVGPAAPIALLFLFFI